MCEAKEIARVKCIYCGKEYIYYDNGDVGDEYEEGGWQDYVVDINGQPACCNCAMNNFKLWKPKV